MKALKRKDCSITNTQGQPGQDDSYHRDGEIGGRVAPTGRLQTPSGGTRPFGLSSGAKLSEVASSNQLGAYTVRIADGGNLVEVKPDRVVPRGDKPIGGPRGQVNNFSRQSRRRLRLLFDSLHRDSVSGALFVTLTYHDLVRDAGRAKRDLQTLCKRLDREYPKGHSLAPQGVSLLWRMELQKRGAIHFHLLVFGCRYLDYKWLAQNWMEVTGGSEEQMRSGTQVEKVRSYGEARRYLEKYLGKVDDDQDDNDGGGLGQLEKPGRWWGVRGSLEPFKAPVQEIHVDAWGMKQLARTLDKLHKARVQKIIDRKEDAPGWMYKWARRRKKQAPYQTCRWSMDAACLLDKVPALTGVYSSA